MNERIKELADNATHYANGVCDVDTTADWYETRDQKFAELIVRECIKESLNEIVSGDEIAQEKDPLNKEYLKGNNQGIVDAVVRFRNHFGVEEWNT